MQGVGSVLKVSATVATSTSTFVLIQAIDWNSIGLEVSDAAMQVVGFVLAHHQELLALLLWLILLMTPYWVKAPLPASDEGPTPFFPRKQRRATKKAQARQHRQILAQRNLSICSARLHRSYPLLLQS